MNDLTGSYRLACTVVLVAFCLAVRCVEPASPYIWIGYDEKGRIVWDVGSKRFVFKAPQDVVPSVLLGLPVSLNSADAQTLSTVSGLGPARSEAIVRYRTMHGCFRRMRDLERVRGIGPRTVAKVAPFLRIDGFEVETCASPEDG